MSKSRLVHTQKCHFSNSAIEASVLQRVTRLSPTSPLTNASLSKSSHGHETPLFQISYICRKGEISSRGASKDGTRIGAHCL